MTDLPKLPPLPDMFCNLDKDAAAELIETCRVHNAFLCTYGVVGDASLWTEEQMRAYAIEAVLMDRAARHEALPSQARGATTASPAPASGAAE